MLPLRDHLVGNVRLAVRLLAGAVLLVLLIACVNVANLLLARGSARERELAVRVALGAAGGRIVRTVADSRACCSPRWAAARRSFWRTGRSGASRGWLRPRVPWIDTLHLDWRASSLLCAAIVVARRAARRACCRPLAGARAGPRERRTADVDGRSPQHRLRAGLVVAEVALALVLVSGAGLLLRSFVSLISVDPGFERDRVLVLQVFAVGSQPDAGTLRAFFDAHASSASPRCPASRPRARCRRCRSSSRTSTSRTCISVVNQPAPAEGDAPRAFVSVASPGYFDVDADSAPDGRLLEQRDGARAARRGDQRRTQAAPLAAVGQPDWTPPSVALSGEPIDVEIVGVVAALKHEALDRPPRPELFMPLAQMPFGSMTFVVRTAGPPAAAMEPAKSAIWTASPRQTIYRAATLDELVMRTMSPRRFALALLLAFAFVALLLSAGGVYGVVSAVTHARRREMGVRLALGASRADITRDVLARGLLMSGMGVAAGLAGALGAGRLIERYLYGVSAWDSASFATASAVMVIAALAACYLPARRAASADPTEVLRSE